MDSQEIVLVSRLPAIWSSIREALRGSHQDFTTGNLNRAIVLLAIPMVLEMVLESLFAVVDVFWVGRLGADAIATVGLTESLLSLVFAVGFGLALSTTAMVARRIGEKDPAGAAVAGVQSILIGIATSLVIGLPCWFYGATPACNHGRFAGNRRHRLRLRPDRPRRLRCRAHAVPEQRHFPGCR